MSTYEERRQARIERIEAAATRAHAKADSLIKAGDEALALIPFGQPILIGHHSESSDRAYRNRATNKIDRGIQELHHAEDLERRAEAARKNRAISSDDPDAPDKLRAKIEQLEHMQAVMKQANAIIRQAPHNQYTEDKYAALVALGISERAAGKAFIPDFCGRIGFPAYALQNNNANIGRLRKRLAEIESRPVTDPDAEPVTTEHHGFQVIENTEENRLQLVFPGKPSAEVRALLKSHGFRWAPSAGAWQRQLNNGARATLDYITPKLAEMLA